MEFIKDFINIYGVKIVYMILAVVFGYLGIAAKKLYTKYADTQTKRDIIKTCVSAVEQMYKDLHGDEKLAKAVEAASEMFASHGITVSAVEMRMMIEAALAEFNNAFNQHDIIEITEETDEDSKDTDNAEDGE